MEVEKELDELLSRGVRQYVVCGGARNAPLIQWLSQLDSVEVYSHFEERGAGFFALGRTMVTGEPCAVVVTSGTAVAELLPAIVEAHYQNRPLIVISADRPERFRGSGAPQAIEQENIFGPYAEKRISFWNGQSPLHLNLPLEEQTTIETSALLEHYVAPRSTFSVASLAQWLQQGIFKGLVVLVGGLDEQDREEVFYFCQNLGAPVLADATSGIREALGDLALVHGDRILAKNPPGKVLRIGEVPVGRFWRDLEDLPEVEVFSISRTGFTGLARESQIITGEPARVIRGLGEIDEIGDVLEHLPLGRRSENRSDELLEAYPDSEPALVRELSLYATQADSVYLGNSLPIREWNDFAQRAQPITLVRACRGANGIDGQLSAWLGTSVEEGKAWGLFGDLTTFYDLAAPHLLSQVQSEERYLVVINNGGGRIFERLPRLASLSEPARQWMTTPHDHSLQHWAAMWNLQYCRIRCREDFDQLEGREPGTTVVELVPHSKQTEKFWNDWTTE